MPTAPKSNRRGQEPEKNRSKNKLTEKASSFHGVQMPEPRIHRPNTLPELTSHNTLSGSGAEKLRKLLLNVTIQGSVGPVQVLIPPDSSVCDLIAAAVQQYKKEALDREEKLTALGWRNFFMCERRAVMDGAITQTSSSPSCSSEVQKVAKNGIPWLRFMLWRSGDDCFECRLKEELSSSVTELGREESYSPVRRTRSLAKEKVEDVPSMESPASWTRF